MALPISAFDADAIIQLEEDQIESFTNKVTGDQICIDNTYNLQVNPIIEITANGAISSITVSNTTNGRNVTCATSLVQNDKLTIKNDMVYKNDTEVTAMFNAPFRLDENKANVLQLTVVGGNSVDISVTSKKASSTQRSQSYLQGFSLTENRTYQKRPAGIMNLYDKNASLSGVTWSFGIDQLLYTRDIFDDNPNSSYRITYRATADDIDAQTHYLCGCRLESVGISQQEEGMVKQAINGFALRRF